MSKPIRPDIQTVNARGNVSVREVLRMVFYLGKPHLTIAQAARDAIDGFVDLVSLKSLAWGFDMEGDPETLTQDVYAQTLADWFSGPYSDWPNASIDFAGQGGNAPEYGLSYRGKVLDEPDFPEDAGFLEVWMTPDFFRNNAARAEQYFRATASGLSSCSAYASLALVGEDTLTKQALAKRYVGVDIAAPGSVSIDIGTKCPGSYWLTYLGTALAQQAGGETELREALAPDVAVEVQPNGAVLIKLGPEPLSGDLNRQEKLPQHEKFARFLHARELLHIPRKVVYFKDEESFADPDAQEAWHLRFIESA